MDEYSSDVQMGRSMLFQQAQVTHGVSVLDPTGSYSSLWILISAWPVAGGVVVDMGPLAAGLTHYDGTYIVALDAVTAI